MQDIKNKSAKERTLYEFAHWLERVYGSIAPREPSEFAVELPGEVMALPECALELALSTGKPVLLASSEFSMKSVIATLVFRRAGLTRDQIYAWDVDERTFVKLTISIGTILLSSLVVEQSDDQIEKNEIV